MRIESVKKAGKFAGLIYDISGMVFKAVVVAGLFAGAIVSQGTLVPQDEISPIGQFLLDNPDQPVDGLGDFLKKLPNITSSKQKMNVKKINLQVAKTCNQYDSLVHKYFGVNFALRKAQMFGESPVIRQLSEVRGKLVCSKSNQVPVKMLGLRVTCLTQKTTSTVRHDISHNSATYMDGALLSRSWLHTTWALRELTKFAILQLILIQRRFLRFWGSRGCGELRAGCVSFRPFYIVLS